MKALALIYILSIQLTNFLYTQQKIKNTGRDEKIIALITSLAEVRLADKYIQRQTHGGRHLETIIDKYPDTQSNNYSLTVAEFNGVNMVPHFKFVVNARTRAISYWDVLGDKTIPLNQWRKKRNE